jgi:hypothetical protein
VTHTLAVILVIEVGVLAAVALFSGYRGRGGPP